MLSLTRDSILKRPILGLRICKFTSAVATPIGLVKNSQHFLTTWTVKNNSPRNEFQISVPLPGLAGLTNIKLKPDDNLEELITAVKIDPSVAKVSILDENQIPFANSTLVKNLSKIESFILKINDQEISVLGARGVSKEEDELITSTYEGFQNVIGILQNENQPKISLKQLYSTFESNGCIDEVCRKVWMQKLHEKGLILHFSYSRDNALSNSVILKPYDKMDDLMQALDIGGAAVTEEISKLESNITKLETELNQITGQKSIIDTSANRRGMMYAWLGLSGLTTQFSVLAYAVWGVYSWDVMEPFCYFLGMGSVIGTYGYFLRTKSDAEYDNMLSNYTKKRAAKLYLANNIQVDKIPNLLKEIETNKISLTVLQKQLH